MFRSLWLVRFSLFNLMIVYQLIRVTDSSAKHSRNYSSFSYLRGGIKSNILSFNESIWTHLYPTVNLSKGVSDLLNLILGNLINISLGGYADISRLHAWNLDFVENLPAGSRYREMSSKVLACVTLPLILFPTTSSTRSPHLSSCPVHVYNLHYIFPSAPPSLYLS